MAFRDGPVAVTVPATSANLGPGFDALGLALDLRDQLTARVLAEGGDSSVEVTGEGAATVPTDSGHLVLRSMARAFDALGCPTPAVHLACTNVIPHGRGLGSSSAAIVAGVCLARALVEGGPDRLDDHAAFALAARIEGHPDNVAPAFFGGFTVAYADGEDFLATSVPVASEIAAVAFVPVGAVETTRARGLLPDRVPFADAAHNAGRAALLVAALAGRPELLFPATEDRLHQDYRQPAMPDTIRLVDALRRDGLAAFVSGAGPTVLVLTGIEDQEPVAGRCPAGWQVLRLGVDREGVRVTAS